MKIAALIQGRMSSSRLPGKVMQDIAGKPMLAWVVDRASRAHNLSQVAVVTSLETSDDSIALFCQQQGYACQRGSLHDVLDRYYQAARNLQADVIVRITADCPLIDPGLVDELLQAFLAGAKDGGAFDFGANRLPPPWRRTYPIGLDVEVCTFTALERAWREADQTFQREHVMPFLYEGLTPATDQPSRGEYVTPRGFRVLLQNHSVDYGSLRWTVDTPQDLELVRQIFARFPGQDNFSWQEVLELFTNEPALARINAGVAAKHVQETDTRIRK